MTTSINRASLLRIAALVRPALATAEYIPALTHIKFDGEFATAFNDQAAIIVQAPIDIKRCVPGDLLIKTLGSLTGDSVAVTFDAKTSTLLLSSGRPKMKLPTLPVTDFPFDPPTEPGPEVTITEPMIEAIRRCLLSVGSDPKHPAQMGVTMEADALGQAVFYSTDNMTISQANTAEKIELPGDSPVILPTLFCEQVVSLSKAFPNEMPVLVLLPGALLVDFVDKHNNSVASLFHKTVIDIEPMDFAAIIKRTLDIGAASKKLVTIPAELDNAIERALLVVSRENVKTTSFTVKGKMLSMNSTTAMGVSDDELPFDAPDVGPFMTDPVLVARALKHCSRVTMHKDVLVFGNEVGDFLHLVSHVKD